jgi:hypothetical protein
MTVVSGLLLARPDASPAGEGDGDRWSAYPAGTSFEIAGHSGFDVRATEPVAYLCEFL